MKKNIDQLSFPNFLGASTYEYLGCAFALVALVALWMMLMVNFMPPTKDRKKIKARAATKGKCKATLAICAIVGVVMLWISESQKKTKKSIVKQAIAVIMKFAKMNVAFKIGNTKIKAPYGVIAMTFMSFVVLCCFLDRYFERQNEVNKIKMKQQFALNLVFGLSKGITSGVVGGILKVIPGL